MPLKFLWDPAKSDHNLGKHGVKFNEAATVFQDPLATTKVDDSHWETENRLLTLGRSGSGRMLLVVHTEEVDNILRIISAREATKRETGTYEED